MMRDSRCPASVVAKFWIAACNFRSRFGSARRAQNEAAWRASYDFPLEKYIGNTTGTRAWKGSRVRQAVRIWERFGASLHHPFYPCHSVTPPRTFHIRYQIGIDRCAALASACARPHHHPFAIPLPSTHLRTPSTPRSPPTTDPPCPTLLLPFLFVCNHIILRTHPCLYISQKYFPVTPYLAAVA